IGYIDLFSGPGRYKDGSASTPLTILEMAIDDSAIGNIIVSVFNDMNADNIRILEQEVNSLTGIDQLKYKPVFNNVSIGDEIAGMFEGMNLIPSIIFVDPWGYKGLSLRLLQSVIGGWGSDIIFFFNYNRINPGLSNPLVEERMDSIFGQMRADKLRRSLKGLNPNDRELLILEELTLALKEIGGEFTIPFSFYDEKGSRTSHHLIFVTKNRVGYKIMKDIMAKESTKKTQGVPSFRYNPADKRYITLFEFSRPLEDLAEMLLTEYHGKELTLEDLFYDHNVGKPYILKNYQDTLLLLEKDGKIKTNPDAKNRRTDTFSERVRIIFP
ncbi:MAG: three-Cys-motif partner protein TcmP, partial [Candidatus Marinimicrobia bacterium]|nr:three-Cys-motif partner protein TcmP [Candidatus Neomarinimicrobiota bacterium]